MKPKKHKNEAATAAFLDASQKATSSNRTRHGPEPERLKISGYKNWEDTIAPLLGKRRPPGGWVK